MASLDELIVVHHPKRSEIIFVAHKAFVQRKIGANCVLCALSIGDWQDIVRTGFRMWPNTIKQKNKEYGKEFREYSGMKFGKGKRSKGVWPLPRAIDGRDREREKNRTQH